jgi:hypothetical protein
MEKNRVSVLGNASDFGRRDIFGLNLFLFSAFDKTLLIV